MQNRKKREIYGNQEIYGNLVITNETYTVNGDLIIIGGTLIMNNSDLYVSGNLIITPKYDNVGNIITPTASVAIENGGIEATSIFVADDIVIKNGDICTGKDLICFDIYSDGDITVHGNSHVCNVYCKNYTINGTNTSYNIEADESVTLAKYSQNYNIKSLFVFLCEGGDFNGGVITAKCFDFDGHVTNCFRRFVME